MTIALENPTAEMGAEALAAHYEQGAASRASTGADHSDLVAEHQAKLKKREQAKRRAKEKEGGGTAAPKKFKF